jgi:hypothetical protein
MRSKSRWVKFCGLPLEYLSPRNLLAAYFVINSIGLIIFSMFVAYILGNLAQPSVYFFANLYPWARPSPGSLGKLSSVLQYVLPIIALLIHYAIYLRLSKYVTDSVEIIDKNSQQKIGFYFLISIVINALLLFIGMEQKLILGVLSILWCVLFLWAPYSVFRTRPLNIALPNWFLCTVLCVISIQYVAIFVPLITKPILIPNDYINISEKTLLRSGRMVDNIGYINEHKIAGLEIYDPRKPNPNFNPNPNPNPNLKVVDSLMSSGSAVFTHILPPTLISDEVQDFLERNSIELSSQTKAGWFLYHHGYNFGPMNALSLGASPYQQTMVYGWLNMVTQGKLLEILGSSNYQGYFKLYFAEYLAYFAIFIFGIWAIFKRLGTVLFAVILTVSALFLVGIEIVKLAPGFNPVRHIFDVPAFYMLYRYLAQDRKIYLILSCALAIFSILWSKDFGLFLALSVGGAVLFKGIKQRPFQLIPLFFGLITAVSGMLLYFYPMPGANPTAMYMLLGVGAPVASSGNVFGLLIIVSLLLTATIAIKQSQAYTILAVGLVLYFVQSLTYYIWYPQLHHIWGVAPVFILWLVLLFNGWVSQSENGEKRQSTVLILLLIFVYLPASVSFYWGMHAYNQTFKNHQLYHWSFGKAGFVSTMEPTLFEEATSLVKQYSPNSNGIFIVSKYDHILPILAGRYSAMPYNELPTNLASPREVKIASEAILKNKPAFLFVDSDIGRNLNGEVPAESDPVTIKLKLFGEARARVMVLEGLNEVYTRVANKYERCENGRLISVYCRKHD